MGFYMWNLMPFLVVFWWSHDGFVIELCLCLLDCKQVGEVMSCESIRDFWESNGNILWHEFPTILEVGIWWDRDHLEDILMLCSMLTSFSFCYVLKFDGSNNRLKKYLRKTSFSNFFFVNGRLCGREYFLVYVSNGHVVS